MIRKRNLTITQKLCFGFKIIHSVRYGIQLKGFIRCTTTYFYCQDFHATNTGAVSEPIFPERLFRSGSDLAKNVDRILISHIV
jgi:hypothetical protein